MPWQMAPPLLIIAGAFTFTGYALNLADNLYYGRNRRTRIDEFTLRMDKRDEDLRRMARLYPPAVDASAAEGDVAHH